MVKFVKSFRNYNVDEVAGFSKQHEAWLISHNIAVKHEVPNGEVKHEGNKPKGVGKSTTDSKDKTDDSRPTA